MIADTTYCPDHECLEPFTTERRESEIPPEAVQVRVVLECGHTKRIVSKDEEWIP